MALAMHSESDRVFRLDLQNRLTRADLAACEHALKAEIDSKGPVRLLVVLDGFMGWDPATPWNDLSFYVTHGDAIERIAIVGPARWRSHLLMFVGAGLRKAPTMYFPPGTVAEARAWLAA